jgi:methyl-accepting chemotaxis protein
MTIANLVRGASAALILVLIAISVLAATRIDAIRMGGPLQLESQRAADLIADILPPPEYVIEPYLEATLLLSHPEDAKVAEARLIKLHQDYTARRDYWQASTLDPELKALLLDGSRVPAERFWSELLLRFVPAAKAGDQAALQRSYSALAAAYSEHRGKVDLLVAAANRYQAGLSTGAASMISATILLLAGLGVLLLGLVAGCAILLLRKVVKPLDLISGVTTRLASGEAATVPFLDRHDELGQIAVAVQRFHMAAIERADSDARAAAQQREVTTILADRLSALSAGDLTGRIDAQFPGDFEALRTNFNSSVEGLRSMMQLVSESAASINTGSQEIANASEDLAKRTEASAAKLAETREAIQEINSHLQASTIALRSTVGRAEGAKAAVERGRGSAERAVASMNRVSASAKDIGSVIEGLDKIAFQTRVLSMNATVEAGRAGDAGRGFAIVADLVGALAQRAEAEAKRVRDLITATMGEIGSAATAVQQTDESLTQISVEVGGVGELLGEIHDDNEAQALAVTDISTAVVAMDISTQQNAAMVEQASAAARHLSSEVGSLAQRSSAFKYEPDGAGVTPGIAARPSRAPGVALH